ncbi:hypothetical protein H310_11711 [Aphanomyces invadans]|uniref:Beta-lactamase-related domain-containing protein n=1 Tax=Aphanomyces invadans TaxID=157072 RepID=A0A024TL69_9STRA|nr:hypothetical protein H310_11711 [Aphanomyces invadans]ETV94749.1 hypothetical protein H310_11711 [Aphanomyces invadans]|eukprot:XP_008876694.1 hypothetical protein H310_11711 [Aphanomyces invadans]
MASRLALVLAIGCVLRPIVANPPSPSIAVTTAQPLVGDAWPADLTAEAASSPATSLADKTELALAFVRKQLKAYAVPGLAVSVVYKNKTVLSQGVGTNEANAPVTDKSVFQIGSYSKTFIAVAIAKLVDEKKLTWQDPVKAHLPSFRLADKYAEEHTTLGDLAGMNSVLGFHEGDLAAFFDVHGSEKGLVAALGELQTARSFRAGHAYSNLNYAILGQVIEAVTAKSWPDYLRATFWSPLGMNDTVGRPADSSALLSSGHFVCGDKVLGPFDLHNASMVALRPRNDYFAAGSILSSVSDLSKFTRFLLNKGKGIFSSDAAVSELITGHTIASPSTQDGLAHVGLTYSRDGNSLTAGYGFDVVGDVAFGHHYFDKAGDTLAHQTRNGFVPDHDLGVVVVANAIPVGGKTSAQVYLDLIRSYIVGVFLDVPIATLNKRHNAIVTALDASPPAPCDPHYFEGKSWETPGLDISNRTKILLNGTYHAAVSPGFYGTAKIFSQGNDLCPQPTQKYRDQIVFACFRQNSFNARFQSRCAGVSPGRND